MLFRSMYVGNHIVKSTAQENHPYHALKQACDDVNADANSHVSVRTPDSPATSNKHLFTDEETLNLEQECQRQIPR